MKKPGKKTIFPALVLAGWLGYQTLGDVVSSTYQKITPDNAQHEVAPDKANALEEILTPDKAYAGSMSEIEQAKAKCSEETGQDNCIYVDDYYKLAEPVDDPDMPEGLRKMPFYAVGSNDNEGHIMRRKDLAVSFDYGEFDDYYFDDKYGPKIKNIFEDNGVNTQKLTNLLSTHSSSSVGLYSSGYMLVFDKTERTCYTFPIKQDIPKKIYDL